MKSGFFSFFSRQSSPNNDDIEMQAASETLPLLSETHPIIPDEKPVIASKISLQEKLLLQKSAAAKKLHAKLYELSYRQVANDFSLKFGLAGFGVSLPLITGTFYSLSQHFIIQPLNNEIYTKFWPTLGNLTNSYLLNWEYCYTNSNGDDIYTYCQWQFRNFITNFWIPDEGIYPNYDCSASGKEFTKYSLNCVEALNNHCLSLINAICEYYPTTPIPQYESQEAAAYGTLGTGVGLGVISLILAMAYYIRQKDSREFKIQDMRNIQISRQEQMELKQLLLDSGASFADLPIDVFGTPRFRLTSLLTKYYVNANILTTYIENHINFLNDELELAREETVLREQKRLSFYEALDNAPHLCHFFAKRDGGRMRQEMLEKIFTFADIEDNRVVNRL